MQVITCERRLHNFTQVCILLHWFAKFYVNLHNFMQVSKMLRKYVQFM